MAPPPPRCAAPLLVALLLAAAMSTPGATATGVFQVRRKFAVGGGGDAAGANISALRAHDGTRHGRLLASADFPLGGLGLPTDTGLYYTEVKLGTPPKRYYVQVDTGSDILWVNCITCKQCPQKSGLGLDLTLYDPKASSTGSMVMCDQGFCASTFGGKLPKCSANVPCEYSVTYGDGSSTIGSFVNDALQFDQVTGDGQAQPANASVIFGCGAQQGGDLGNSNQALDGILGFGEANTSMLSQLATAGKVKKIFAHCLDTINGGGIFAIGDVVQPKVKTTPFVADKPHYNVNLKTIDVGGTTLQLPAHIFEPGEKKGTIIDSGTTLTYLPELVFKEVMLTVFNKHQDITFHDVQEFLCFQYSGSVDDGFPTVTFHFENDLALHVYPHEYFFPNGNDMYCVGFQNGALQSKDGKDIVLMGDLVLSNKLVVYDLENRVIGWTDYNSAVEGCERTFHLTTPVPEDKIIDPEVPNKNSEEKLTTPKIQIVGISQISAQVIAIWETLHKLWPRRLFYTSTTIQCNILLLCLLFCELSMISKNVVAYELCCNPLTPLVKAKVLEDQLY